MFKLQVGDLLGTLDTAERLAEHGAREMHEDQCVPMDVLK